MNILNNKPILERAVQFGAYCDICPLHDKKGPVYFKPKQQEPIYNFDISCVGYKPGNTELGRGIPFAGMTGFRWKSLLRDVHIKEEEIHISNAVLCTATEGIS